MHVLFNLSWNMMAPYFAFLHHIAAFTLFAALVIELVLVRDELTVRTAKNIRYADMAFGIAAGFIILVGFLRVFYFEKGADYYFHSTFFNMKIIAFIIVGLLSIYPTVVFLSWSKALKSGQLPAVSHRKMRIVRRLIHVELAGVVVVILCAALMAKGA
jgi:putative membrane protein